MAGIDLTRPPPGAWYKPTSSGFAIGATTRSATAIILVLIAGLWSKSVGSIFIRPLWSGQFTIIPTSFIIPFLLGSILLIAMSLMSIAGKVEVERDGDDGKVFVGLWEVGWSSRFRWSEIESIREDRTSIGAGFNRYPARVIVIEAATRVAFGSRLSAERRYFLLQGLKRLRMTR